LIPLAKIRQCACAGSDVSQALSADARLADDRRDLAGVRCRGLVWLVVPAGTPRDVTARLNAETLRVP